MVNVEEENLMFFKVLLGDFKDKLYLSGKFAALPKKWPELKLKTALGDETKKKKKKRVWSVDIRNSDGMFYLTGDGWRRFIDDHDLRFGYFLIFIYCSDVTFYVIPFDLSGFRIAYNGVNKPIGIENNADMDVDEDDVKSKIRVTDNDNRLKLQKIRKQNMKVKNKPQFKKIRRPTRCFEMEKWKKTNEGTRLKDGKNHLLKCTLRQSSIQKGILNLSTRFCQENNLLSVNQAVLTTEIGSWTVKICHCPRKYSFGRSTSSFFSAGITSFFRENNLKTRDVCIFELLSVDENRANFCVTKEDGDTLMMAAKEKNTVENRPQFKIILRPVNRLNFPTSFRNSNDLSRIDEVTLLTKESIGRHHWPVRFRHYLPENRSSFTFGWTTFKRESGFKEGDVCIFELFSKKGNTATFLVSKEDDFSREKDTGSRLIRPHFEATEEVEFYRKNDTGSPLIPSHFDVTIKRRYLCSSRFEVHVPVKFGLHHLINKSSITLKRNGKSWEVRVVGRTNGTKTNTVYRKLTTGWKRFCFDNELKEGDVCSLKLVSIEAAKNLEMVVDIKRKHPILCRNNAYMEPESSFNRPHFQSTVTNTHIFGKISELHIPVSFNAVYYLHNKSMVTLTNSVNDSWEVTVTRRLRNGYMSVYYRFSNGWKEFCIENRLENGDICTFELVSEQNAAKIEMRVTFHKK